MQTEAGVALSGTSCSVRDFEHKPRLVSLCREPRVVFGIFSANRGSCRLCRSSEMFFSGKRYRVS